MVTLFSMLDVVGDHSRCTLRGSIKTARLLESAIHQRRKRSLKSDAGIAECAVFLILSHRWDCCCFDF